MEVSVRELKDRLSHYLQLARDGELVVVTSHNKPVATLRGSPQDSATPLQRLVVSGAVRWRGGTPKLTGLRKRIRIVGEALSETVLRLRG